MWNLYKMIFLVPRAISGLFGAVCICSFIGYVWILGLSSRSALLIPVAIVLLPLALLLGLLAVVTYPIAMVPGLISALALGVHASPDESGLRLTEGPWRLMRHIPWRELREFKCVFSPPLHAFLATMDSGEVIRIDFARVDAIAAQLEARGIPFPGLDKPVRED